MFHVDRSTNRITRLDARSFSDLGLRERVDLQEWLAGTPEALGEELLIIQKEFDGFADTRERLDLLALDKDGKLVIIENKLDDSGRDVVWQVIKYAAYCSNLNKTEIVEIFQRYLDRRSTGESAETKICDFLDEDSLEEVVLNAGNDQRVMLIAGNFRKDHWLSCGTGVSGVNYTLIFLRHEARVELTLQRSDAEDNKWLFDSAEGEKGNDRRRFWPSSGVEPHERQEVQ